MSNILLFGAALSALIRAYKLENYFLLLDKKPTISYFQHYKGMMIELSNLRFAKPFVVYLLVKPLINKSDYENERKQVNIYTFSTYILIVFSIVAMIVNKK